MPRRLQPSNFLKVVITEREEWENGAATGVVRDGSNWFPDGSSKGGLTGAGVCAETGQTAKHFALGTHATVFQVEVLAILYCGLELLSGPRQEDAINICSDSRTAIMAISAEVVHSKLVVECKTTLEKLAQKNDIRRVWVPGHAAIPENEEADRLAKLGIQN